MQTPTQGRIVTVKGPKVTHNGMDEQAAIITRVWSVDHLNATALINTQVFVDAHAVFNVLSISLYSDRRAAEDAPLGTTYAFWPDR